MLAEEMGLLYSHGRGAPTGIHTRTATNAAAIAAFTGSGAAAAAVVTARRVLSLSVQARKIRVISPVRRGAREHGRGRRLLIDPLQGGPHHVADERGCPPWAPRLSCESKETDRLAPRCRAFLMNRLP